MTRSLSTLIACFVSCSLTLADEYTLESITERPDLPEAISQPLAPAGVKISGRRELCSVWLVEKLDAVAGFQKSGTITYPLTPGQLIGVLSVPRRSELVDFKGHKIEAGVYTLRYGRQPQDGNHVGTSDTLDFLMALPIGEDQAAELISDQDTLVEKSSVAAGTTHPAIFSLLPIDQAPESPRVAKHPGTEFFVLETTTGTANGSLPVRLVLVGISEGA